MPPSHKINQKTSLAHSDRVSTAILFGDMKGSTENAEQNELGAVKKLRKYLTLTENTVKSFKPKFFKFKSEGDGFMVLFPNLHLMVECGFALQKKFRKLGWRVRLGGHYGEAFPSKNGDMLGADMNRCARIEAAADAARCQFLVSDVVQTAVRDRVTLVAFKKHGRIQAKGVIEGLVTFEVVPVGESIQRERLTAEPMLFLAKNLTDNISRLKCPSEVRESVINVLSQPDFPRWMSVSNTLVQNPVWGKVPPLELQKIVKKYKLDSPTAPKIMHLDMLLIRRNDIDGRGQLFTYFSEDWKAPLIPFRQWGVQDNAEERHVLNARIVARRWGVPENCIRVNPEPGMFAVSAKLHAKHQDLIVYIFEFCSVVFKTESDFLIKTKNAKVSTSGSGPWFSLRSLRNSEAVQLVNADVVRAIHELFTVSLDLLPVSFP